MTVEPKSLGIPTVDQCKLVYRSMLKPTVRTFRAKLLDEGYDISHTGAARFILKYIKKVEPKPKAKSQPPIGSQLTADELSQIQRDLTELRALDVTALKPMFEKEVLIYSIMLMRFSQRNADRLAMAPKDSAAMVKSMSEATKGAPIPVIMPDGNMIDITPNAQNEVSSAINMFLKQEGVAA